MYPIASSKQELLCSICKKPSRDGLLCCFDFICNPCYTTYNNLFQDSMTIYDYIKKMAYE